VMAMQIFTWRLCALATMMCFFLVSLISASEKKYYIYDWPTYIDDVWPPDGAALHNRSAYNFEFRPNRGAGKLL